MKIDDVRRRLEGKEGPEFWRSLDELAGTAEFEEMLHREFPAQAGPYAEGAADGVNRRRFLQLSAASLAMGGLTACTRQPPEKIVPFVEQPENIVPGRPLFYATAVPMGGYAAPVLAESHMGRPTKLEGNPDHPASRGATDVFTQAQILGLYDPDRSRVVKQLGRPRTWKAFTDEITKTLAALDALGGAKIAVLTGAVTSPSLAVAIDRLLAKFPRGRWHAWESVGAHSARAAAEQAFGEPVETVHDFSKADVVVALDSDFLTQGPGSVAAARDFADRRRLHGGGREMTRLYSVESAPSATGSVADHRIPASPARVAEIAAALAAAVGVSGVSGDAGDEGSWVEAMARDLLAHRGASVVVAGEGADASVHVLAHAMNEVLGNVGTTVRHVEPIDRSVEAGSIGELVEAMNADEVDVLVVLGANPVYDAPADLRFAEAMLKVAHRAHVGLYDDETAELCQWHVPEAHALEAWGDVRSADGTVTIQQPLIEPLYGGRSCLEVVATLAGDTSSGEELVQEHWRTASGASDFTGWWRRALHDGLVPASEAATKNVTVSATAFGRTQPASGITAVFRPDPTVWDGRFANNAWLQECPKPLTKLTWDNAVMIGPALAAKLGLAHEQKVRVTAGDRSVEAATWVQPGIAGDTVVLHLGYGRRRAGRVGNGTGFDFGALRTTGALASTAVTLEPLAGTYTLATTQLHHNIEEHGQGENLEGREAEKRHLVRTASLGHYREHPDFAQHMGHTPGREITLMPEHEYPGYAWGLTVDLGACTGCNACVVACQAENNIPTVGKDQVAMGREMHWIRVDRYFQGDLDNPSVHHQPVMCMHCEQAPCEVVCPVSATVHSDEGLNDMVYNRCVGTRYCSNNCPYKVRRFNFLKYNDTDTPVLSLLRNPDVTVRFRGVMEKCTYCVQRINGARQDAKRDGRKIRDGEIVTACQQACPSGAIVFGDTNDPDAAVSKQKADPLNYATLAELGTWPRTTYLAKVKNPNGDLVSGNGNGHSSNGHGSGGHA